MRPQFIWRIQQLVFVFVAESASSPQTNTDSSGSGDGSRRPPIIIITAPSREDIYATPTNMTVADAIKERRPTSTPFVVGRKFMKNPKPSTVSC